VEAAPDFLEMIAYLMEANGVRNVVVENAFIEDGGSQAGAFQPDKMKRKTLDELLAEHGFDDVDLMKVDIEGSEFGAFPAFRGLERVRRISMEVHPHAGDVAALAAGIGGRGFEVAVCDAGLRPAADPQKAVYLFARNLRAAARAPG
jgi:hypothetical protein